MNKFFILHAAVLGMVIGLATAESEAQLINFDFDRDDFDITAANNDFVGSAVIGSPGDIWNDGQPEQDGGSYTGLLDSAGNVTTANLNTSFLFSFGANDADFGEPLNNLMRDYAFVNPSQNGGVGTASLTGLPANAPYTLYLYGVSNSAAQNTTFSVTGANQGSQTAASNDLSGPFVVDDDYVVFTGNTGAGGFDITIDGAGNFAAFNGFQLDVGAPSTNPPSAPTLVSPSDTSTDVSVFTELEWSGGSGAAEYDVFLWETSQPTPTTPTASVTTLTYAPGELNPLTDYSWFVEAVNPFGETASDTWSFTTGETPVRSADTLVNVDFGKGTSPVQSGAAATGIPGDFWNSTDTEANIFLTDLTDADGNPTSIDLSWTDELQSSVAPGDIEFGSTGHNNLMEDYSFTAGGDTATVTISDLPANTDYTLYLYGVPNGQQQDTLFAVTNSNEGSQAVLMGNVNDDNGLSNPDDFVVFTGNTGAGGSIVYTQTSASGLQGGFSGSNGFQLELGVLFTSLANYQLESAGDGITDRNSSDTEILTMAGSITGGSTDPVGTGGGILLLGEDFDEMSTAAAFAAGDYLEFTISLDQAESMSLSELSFGIDLESAESVFDFALRSSIDGFGADIPGSIPGFSGIAPGSTAVSFDLTAIAGLQSLSTDVTFRLAFANAIFDIGNGNDALVTNLRVFGSAESGGLAGDFNGDGTVDLADYTIWRNNLGATEDGSVLSGNGDGGIVDEDDYLLWKSNFRSSGAVSPLSENAAVPEPGTTALLSIALVSLYCAWGQRCPTHRSGQSLK